MKETYYKLTDKGKEAIKDFNSEAYPKLLNLFATGILEEVQDTKEDYLAINTTTNKFEKACNNMFDNPLEQVDDMIEGTKVEEGKALLMTAAELDNRVKKYLKKQEEKTLNMLNNNSKPFLNKIKPNKFIQKHFNTIKKTNNSKNRNIINYLNHLMKKLKKNNVIK